MESGKRVVMGALSGEEMEFCAKIINELWESFVLAE